jgi:phenylalanyl-tRNA synthetase beta chain
VYADDIMKTIKKAAGNLLVKQEMFDMYQNAALGDKKSVAFSLTFGSNDKTLTDDEINPVMEKIIKALESNLKAELRK